MAHIFMLPLDILHSHSARPSRAAASHRPAQDCHRSARRCSQPPWGRSTILAQLRNHTPTNKILHRVAVQTQDDCAKQGCARAFYLHHAPAAPACRHEGFDPPLLGPVLHRHARPPRRPAAKTGCCREKTGCCRGHVDMLTYSLALWYMYRCFA